MNESKKKDIITHSKRKIEGASLRGDRMSHSKRRIDTVSQSKRRIEGATLRGG